LQRLKDVSLIHTVFHWLNYPHLNKLQRASPTHNSAIRHQHANSTKVIPHTHSTNNNDEAERTNTICANLAKRSVVQEEAFALSMLPQLAVEVNIA
jgi:hypothetical protein